jgi:hypothetical protein
MSEGHECVKHIQTGGATTSSATTLRPSGLATARAAVAVPAVSVECNGSTNAVEMSVSEFLGHRDVVGSDPTWGPCGQLC